MMSGVDDVNPTPNNAEIDVPEDSTMEESDTDVSTPRGELGDGSTAGLNQVANTDDSDGGDTTGGKSNLSKSTEGTGEVVVNNGMSAGISFTPEQSPRESSSNEEGDGFQKLPEPDSYEDAPFISHSELEIQPGDFIRYMKEDGVIYQGYVQHGTPVENGYNPYEGQEDDFVVNLKYDNGKHVAPNSVQQESRMTVLLARDQTAQGRNVEPVSPDEILAVSPENAYDWYRLAEAWDTSSEELDVGD